MKLHHAEKFVPHTAPRMESEASTTKFARILGVHVNGHDTSVAVVEHGELVEVIEFERVFREKHFRTNVLHPRFPRILAWLFDEYKMDPRFDAVALHLHRFGAESRQYVRDVQETAVAQLSKYVPDAHYLQLNHHLCHAASGYFLSPFDKACILSFDGHGNDGSTLGFSAHGNQISYVRDWPCSMGRAYTALSNIIGGIHSRDGNSAGKVMGLTAYGEVIDSWREPIRQFISSYQGIRSEFSPLYWEASVADEVFYLPGFGAIEGKNAFGGPDSKAAQDFATTFQAVWTEIVKDMVRELIQMSGSRTVCLVGGCALNAATNYEILQMPEVADLHLVPHPNDDGLSVGAALYTYYGYQNVAWKGAKNRYFSPYLGVPVLDSADLPALAAARNAQRLESPAKELAALIAQGTKVGVIQGRSELGPRALGNRSIICDPRDPAMKDTLNNDVKGREWYRPFAPFVKQSEQHRYFDLSVPAPYMSYIGYVLPEWVGRLPAITHADGTARVQTVTKDQNAFLWDLLDEFEKLTGVGVLLNTSFNGKGEPIISRVSEALAVLDSTRLDAVYADGWLFKRDTTQ